MNNLKESSPEKYSEIVEKVCDLLGLDEDEVRECTNVNNDLGFDSLDEIEFIMDCEQIFGISISDDKAEATHGDWEAICNAIQSEIEN